jgi:hypothetical protein
MTKTYCDRCGDEVPPDKLQQWPVPVSQPDGWHSQRVDICPACMKVLASFLERKLVAVK